MSDNQPVIVDFTIDTPQIHLDAQNAVFKIEGASYPEDAYLVYTCVLEWLEENNFRFENEMICDFKFNVLSSGSRKLVYEILLGLEKAHRKSGNVKVQWFYEKFDEDMLQVGEDFLEHVNIPFKLLPV